MSTAWAYVVVSSDRQEETLDFQQSWAEHTAAEHGWNLTRVFRGVSSGRLGTRKLLEQLISELRATPKPLRPKRILMVRLDRTGRGIGLDALAAIAEIHELGVMLHTREDGDVQLSRAADVLKPVLRVLTGALENEARSDKSKAGHARRRAAGLHIGSIPFGVVLVDGRAHAYEPEAAIVRQVFARAAEGWGYTRLARWLQDVAPVKYLGPGRERPLRWAPASVKGLLIGSTIRRVVVGDELWNQAHAVRKTDFRARASRRWPWPLSGVVRCICGWRLTGHVGGVGKYKIRYYFCRKHPFTETGKGQTYPAHRADDLERNFARRLSVSGGSRFLIAAPRKPKTTVKSLEARESAARRRLDAIETRRKRAWAMSDAGTLTPEQLRERLDEIDTDRDRARKEVARIQREREAAARTQLSNETLQQALSELAGIWNDADVDDRKEIARAVAAVCNGLFTIPERRGEIFTRAELGAMLRTCDHTHTIAPYDFEVAVQRLATLARAARRLLH